MKKFALFVISLFALCLCACSSSDSPPEIAATAPPSSEPADPISVKYAEEITAPYKVAFSYAIPDLDYPCTLVFTANETLEGISFHSLEFAEDGYKPSEVLCSFSRLLPDESFCATICFWGDMTAYGISFTDSRGEEHFLAVSVSGKDGSAVLWNLNE